MPFRCSTCGQGAKTAWPNCPICGALGSLKPKMESPDDPSRIQVLAWFLLLLSALFYIWMAF